jgi:uncharacterized protein YndB with AHSA1/START domain
MPLTKENSMKIDVGSYIGAVAREVTGLEHDGRAARAIVATRAYDTSIENLWDAITSPERLSKWFLPVSGDLCIGGRYQLQGNASGQIIRCDAPTRLQVTWEFGGEMSWVHVSLAKEKQGASLRLEHISLIPADKPDEWWQQYGPGGGGVGWELGFVGLTLHLSSDELVDPKAIEAWTAGEDGRHFIAESSKLWGVASILAGTSEADATAAAERTTAFYTGQGPSE